MNDIIVLYEYYTIIPDNNLGYIFEVNDCKYVKSNGDVGFMSGEEARVQAHKIEKKINKAYNSWVQYSSYKYPMMSIIYVREDFKEMFEKYRKPGMFFASTFWTKLQNIFGHYCKSKLDKVAKPRLAAILPAA